MNIFQVLKYVSVLTSLLDLFRLIRAAEDSFGAGNGDQKLAEVLTKWGTLITTLRTTGLISERIASAFISGAPIIIGTIVQVLNAFGVFQKDEPTIDAAVPGAPPTGPAKYAEPFDDAAG